MNFNSAQCHVIRILMYFSKLMFCYAAFCCVMLVLCCAIVLVSLIFCWGNDDDDITGLRFCQVSLFISVTVF